jgi:hypothetical protein
VFRHPGKIESSCTAVGKWLNLSTLGFCSV